MRFLQSAGEMLGAYRGRALTVAEAVYQSERTTGHCNRAIGHMRRNIIPAAAARLNLANRAIHALS